MLINGFGGSHNTVVMRSRDKNGFNRETRFWAERGLIHCEDNVTGYSSMSVLSFMHRVRALNDTLGNSDSSRDTGADADMREQTQRTVEQMIHIAELAKEQGMPSDASARRDNQRRRKKVLCMSSSSNSVM